MDVCKKRNPEADKILAERFGFGGTLQCNGQCGSRGHGPYGSQIGRTIMADNLQRIFSGIDSCKDVKKSHPDKMPGKHQYDDLQKKQAAVW